MKFPQVNWKSTLDQYKYVLLVIVAGVLLMALPTGESEMIHEMEVAQSYDVAAFESRLGAVLSLIDGAGEAQVIVTLKNEGKRILAQDIEQEGGGVATVSTVTVNAGTGVQEVVEVEHQYPQFQGVVVVCEGGGNPQVKLDLIAAVSALTGLDSNEISISKGSVHS
ncbi:MAG: stage III sporulation protein AG [Eubacteriales bacterium]